MPSRKQFPSLNLTVPFTIENLDMFQLTDMINNHIKAVLEYLDKDKRVVFELVDDESLVTIKKANETIILKVMDFKGEGKRTKEIEFNDGMDFIKWLYVIAPLIQVVGISNIDN